MTIEANNFIDTTNEESDKFVEEIQNESNVVNVIRVFEAFAGASFGLKKSKDTN